MVVFKKFSFILFLVGIIFFMGCNSLKNPIAAKILYQEPPFLKLKVDKWDCSKNFIPRKSGESSVVVIPKALDLKEWPVFPALIQKVPRGEGQRLQFKVSHLKGNNGTGWKINLPKNTDIYGGGEVRGSLLRNDSDISLWGKDNFFYIRSGGTRLYQAHPWLMAVKSDGSAYGFIFMTTTAARMKVKDNTIYFGATETQFPFLILYGDTPDSVLKQLSDWTGKMELPPLWALGYQQCRWSYHPDSRVKEIADEFRSRKIPCDVIWMDIHYMDGYRIFTFDPKEFLDPKGLNNYLHQKDFHSVWMIDPGVKVDDDYLICQQGTDLDIWVKRKNGENFTGRVWPGDCYFPDFTQQKTAKWWAGLYKDYLDQGIDGVWNDMNEPSVFDGPDGTMPISNQHFGGLEMENGSVLPAGDHLQYHNLYGMLMVKASREGLLKANPHKRPFILSRSNFLGGQRYAATWTGDNYSSVKHLLMSIPMSLTFGLSGQPFNGPDIGGFGGRLDGKLMSQWMGIGAFFPFSRGHAMSGTNDKEPWVFGQEVELSCKTSIERRYALMPYYYTLFYESADTGLPVMRPVFMADAKDLSLRDEDLAFMVGSDLIVVPQFSYQTREAIKLPKGNWKEIIVANENPKVDLTQPKLLLREGAAIPTIQPIQSTVDYNVKELSLIYNPTKEGWAVGYLYEDGGDGFGYREGDFCMTRFDIKVKDGIASYSSKVIDGKRKSEVQRVHLVLAK